MGRTSTSGAAGYRKGAAHEREVASFLRERGALVVRSPQSGQAMDLTAVWPAKSAGVVLARTEVLLSERTWLVQCKLGAYMRPAEREELIQLAKQYGCRPVMVGRKPFVFTDLTTGGQIEPPQHPIRTDSPAHREVPVSAKPD